MKNAPVRKICLNGWWDISPVFKKSEKEEIPETGWLKKKYLVPSFWTKPEFAVRKKGEVYFQNRNGPEEFTPEDEFLLDAFDYPLEWSKTRSAWVRRSLPGISPPSGKRYFLRLEAALPRSTLFVNRTPVAVHIHPSLPLEVDITDYLEPRENELVLLIEDFERDKKGRTKVPSGNFIHECHSGIWQDVFLIERGEVYTSDITIRPSVRKKEIVVIFEITNRVESPKEIQICPTIVDWRKGLRPEEAQEVMAFEEHRLDLNPGETRTFEVAREWENAVWWCPENPHLYQIRTIIKEGDKTLECSYERFGFREVNIAGADLILNNYPLHLFSDWGHKATPYYYTEAWIRQWFGMMRAGNMNHSRLHTHPHPELIMNIADEEGILITGETGLHGSGGLIASDSSRLWEAARDHIRRLVKRDKNHPSVIMWSVENEMRWNAGERGLAVRELPQLRKLFNRLDPTRPAYHEGDSSLWNEKEQEIISRHYGKECSGVGWWDRARPLHSGELALYHYEGPNNTGHLRGDETFARYQAVNEAAALDTTLIIEAGRTRGVCCFAPWNQSCLQNLRPETRTLKLEYDDYTAPGIKPLVVPAHSSEFEFWKEGKGYYPNYSFAYQKKAFRPFALIDLSLKNSYFTGSVISRRIFLVNDTTSAREGELQVSLKSKNKKPLCLSKFSVFGERGRVVSREISWEVPAATPPGVYDYTAAFIVNDEVLDTWTRTIKLCRRVVLEKSKDGFIKSRVVVFGKGLLKEVLTPLGINFSYKRSLGAESLKNADILIMEKDTVEPGSKQNKEVQLFVQKGGRLIVMEQTDSLFPSLRMEDKPVLTAFRRAYGHSILEGVEDSDLQFWGEDPYPLLAGDAYVAERMYRKDDGRLLHPLLDSGEGGFGTGNMDYTPLFESKDGKGLIIVSQLRLTDKMSNVPAAESIFLNILQRADTFRAEEPGEVIVMEGNDREEIRRSLKVAGSGKTVIVNNAAKSSLSLWAQALAVDLRAKDGGEVYQAVRVKDEELLSGVSNEDTCGVETWAYTSGEKAANFLIGKTFLSPAKGLESILETPTESLLKEMFVYGGKTEMLKAHTVSRFLYQESPQPAIVLGRVKCGSGQIIFNQFAPPWAERARFRRLLNRMLANLGIMPQGSILEGESVPAPTAVTGPGFPEKVFILNTVCDDRERQFLLENTIPSMERMKSTPILNRPGWREAESREGIYSAQGLDILRDIYIYYCLFSPRPRKNLERDLGVPNPESFTFMDIYGEGKVQVTINGRVFDEVEVADGEATISDLSLEGGYNQVLVKWVPLSQNSTLQMKWRDIMRQPERAFRFE